jgi:MFS family permease
MDRRPRTARSNIRRLAAGRLISVTGGAAAFTALNFTVWEQTHSPGVQALSLLLTFGVAGILGPFAGALGDRFDRRKVMIASEAVAAAVFLAMAFARSPAWLIGIAFVAAIAELPFFSASRAAIPNLIDDEDQLAWANSLVTIGVHAGIAIGPVIGGTLLALIGPSWVFALNAASFVVSLGLTLTIRGSFQKESEAHDEHGGLVAGIAFLWRDRVMRRMSIAWLVFLLGMGIGMVADAALAESFGAGEIGYALLITAWGTGSVFGSAAGRWMTPATEPRWLVFGAFGISAAAFGVGLAPLFPLVLLCLFLMGMADGFTIVAENGIMQRRTPDVIRSRTMAAFEAVLSFGLAIAYLLAGPVLTAVGPQGGYIVGGLTAATAAVALIPLLALRREALPVEAGGGPQIRYTSAEGLDGEAVPLTERSRV